MLARTLLPVPALIVSFLMMLHLPVTSSRAEAEVALSGDGIVKVRSGHGFDETIDLLEKDIAAKGIMFFMAIDQSKLGANAGIKHGTAKETDPPLAKLIGRAVAVRNELLTGSDESIDAMARRLRAKRDHLTVLVRLSYLAPDVVRAILDGRHPIALTPTRLRALSKDLPHSWMDQRQYLGFAAE